MFLLKLCQKTITHASHSYCHNPSAFKSMEIELPKMKELIKYTTGPCLAWKMELKKRSQWMKIIYFFPKNTFHSDIGNHCF